MIDSLPLYITLFFIFTTLLTVFYIYNAGVKNKWVIASILDWLIIQGLLGYYGFYHVTDTIPPRFFLLLAPPLFVIFVLFYNSKCKKFIDSLSVAQLTYLHIVRVPVELILYSLLLYNQIPQLMTFEGCNFDILAGVTAPFIAFFGIQKNKLNRTVLLLWNVFAMCLLINIVTIAILSTPTPFQRFAFDKPNVAVLYFPFVWLPSCVVPIVFFSHLVCIRRLLYSNSIIN